MNKPRIAFVVLGFKLFSFNGKLFYIKQLTFCEKYCKIYLIEKIIGRIFLKSVKIIVLSI